MFRDGFYKTANTMSMKRSFLAGLVGVSDFNRQGAARAAGSALRQAALPAGILGAAAHAAKGKSVVKASPLLSLSQNNNPPEEPKKT